MQLFTAMTSAERCCITTKASAPLPSRLERNVPSTQYVLLGVSTHFAIPISQIR